MHYEQGGNPIDIPGAPAPHRGTGWALTVAETQVLTGGRRRAQVRQAGPDAEPLTAL